jgi:hypothetical protein
LEVTKMIKEKVQMQAFLKKMTNDYGGLLWYLKLL